MESSVTKADKTELARRSIRQAYNVENPKFAYICGGMRRISVDSGDKRAQMQLLRHGRLYFSKMQALIFAIDQLFSPDLLIDVGANYGECLFSLPIHSATTALGFEANPALIAYLERSLVYNDDLKVELVAKAVSDGSSSAAVEFAINEGWSGKSSMLAAGAVARKRQVIRVPVTSIDAEIAARGLAPRTAVMKIDVEGFEPQVMAGAGALIAETQNLLVTLEFDSGFLTKVGSDAEAFFEELARSFRIFVATRSKMEQARTFAELGALAQDNGRIHCDLFLVKSQDASFDARLQETILTVPLPLLVKDAWNLRGLTGAREAA